MDSGWEAGAARGHLQLHQQYGRVREQAVNDQQMVTAMKLLELLLSLYHDGHTLVDDDTAADIEQLEKELELA